jgi:hypothetical protein
VGKRAEAPGRKELQGEGQDADGAFNWDTAIAEVACGTGKAEGTLDDQSLEGNGQVAEGVHW